MTVSRGYLIRAVVLVAAVVLCFLFLPLEWSMVAVVFLITIFILIDARKHSVLFRMARRNFMRRKSTTALVIGGLMVGTAIISASFVVGDTLGNMIGEQVTAGAGDVDFIVAEPDDQGGYTFYNSSFSDALSQELAGIEHVSAVSALVSQSFSIYCIETQLSTPGVTTTGMNESLWRPFGGFQGVDGDDFYTSPSALGCYLFESTAKDLGAMQGDHVILLQGSLNLTLTVEAIVENNEPGQTNLQSQVWMDISTLRQAFGHEDESNVWFIHNAPDGSEEYGFNDQVRDDIDATLTTNAPGSGLEIVFDVKQILVEGQSSMEMFTQLFLVFGSFSVIAGVVLVINIFTMLGEERKSEMGMARALGMRRADLRRLQTYEGLLYAVASSAVGSLVGLGLAYVLVYAIEGIFQFGDVKLTQYFYFTPFGLIVAFVAGFLLTLVTVYFTTRRISNLNIVRAIRNIPEPPLERHDRRAFSLGLMALGGGAAIMIIGIITEQAGAAYSGLSLMTLSLGLILRRYIGDRSAWSIAGIATLLVWMPYPGDFEIFPNTTGGFEMFIVSGLFMVAGSLILVIFNSSSLVWFITKLFRTRGSYRAVAVTAVAYPLRARFRTGLSIFIFGLVIFTVTVLSMMSSMIGAGVATLVEESSGGFDLVAFKTLPSPMPDNPWEYINSTDYYQPHQQFIRPQNISNMIWLPANPVTANYTGIDAVTGGSALADRGTSVIGFNQRFFTEGNFPLSQWNSSQFPSQDEVYEAVLNDPSLIIVDGGWAVSSMNFGPGMGTAQPGLEVGTTVRLQSINGTFQNVTVVGIMKQQFFNGVFMNQDLVFSTYGAVGPSVLLIDFTSGLDVAEQAALVERQFLPWGVQTLNVQALAEAITSAIDSVFVLFRAFLAIGLVIGIVGLGIITIRSINERKLEIGMMRAIGFRKRMVVVNFAIESGFVAAIGIIIGTAMGIIIGYTIWKSNFMGDFEFPFVIPWWPILLVAAAAFAATVLCVYPAARGASKVSPAEVLRFD